MARRQRVPLLTLHGVAQVHSLAKTHWKLTQELEAVGAGPDLEALLAAQSAKRGAKDADPLADP